jgi:hypothetical protein
VKTEKEVLGVSARNTGVMWSDAPFGSKKLKLNSVFAAHLRLSKK